MLVVVKFFITVLFYIFGLFLYETARYGRMFRKEWAKNDPPRMRLLHIGCHRLLANISLWLCIASIVAAETYVRINGGLNSEHKELFHIHLSFALPLLLSLLTLRFWLTGVKSPRLHKWLGYICLISYCGTFLTGIILLWK